MRPHPWHRFVAMGDSFTEGLDDPEPLSPGGYRGWADRVAEELSIGVDDFAYANLAVRGQVLHQVFETQLGHALALKPDLVSLQAGGNDLFHPGVDPDKLAAEVENAVEIFGKRGVNVLIFVVLRFREGYRPGPIPHQDRHLQRESAGYSRTSWCPDRRPAGP
ncbi:SGNH/GDSL hydrolase family protein [Arthrobacter psychrolactophilus]